MDANTWIHVQNIHEYGVKWYSEAITPGQNTTSQTQTTAQQRENGPSHMHGGGRTTFD